MSFSSEVKEELSRQISTARHCQIAEIAAIISMCGGVSISAENQYSLKIHTENISVARKYFTLLKGIAYGSASSMSALDLYEFDKPEQLKNLNK